MRLSGDAGGVRFSRIEAAVSIVSVSRFRSSSVKKVNVGDWRVLLCFYVVVRMSNGLGEITNRSLEEPVTHTLPVHPKQPLGPTPEPSLARTPKPPPTISLPFSSLMVTVSQISRPLLCSLRL